MKPLQVTSNFTVYEQVEELPHDLKQLYQKAVLARTYAYAPYSKFSVGAALLLENGQIITGNNQENAAYPSGMCAERVAIWYASSQYPNVAIKKIFITAISSKNKVTKPVAPCGACRQVISEYECKQKQNIEIYFTGETGAIIKANSINDLLPLAFDNTLL